MEAGMNAVARHWEGKEVWVVLDSKEGLWRQAQCVCVIPAEQDNPSGQWSFVVDTRHDSWRHLVKLSSNDGMVGKDFDHIKLSDAAELHSGDHVFKGWQSPAWFDISTVNPQRHDIKDGAVALHPYVSSEINDLRKINLNLVAQVTDLETALELKTQECIDKTVELARVESILAVERRRFKEVEDELVHRLTLKEREVVVLEETNARLTLELDDARHLVNQAQADNNVLRSRLQLMLDELVKVKALVTNLQLEVSEKRREIATLKKENEDQKVLLQMAYDKNLFLEEKLRALELEHYKLVQEHSNCEVIKHSLQEELERLRRRPMPVPPPPVVQVVQAPAAAPAAHDDSALLALLAQYESQYETIWRIIYETLVGLSDRVSALEDRADWPRKTLGPVDVPGAKGPEGVVEGRRLASQLGGEVSALQSRIEQLEGFLNTQPATPPPVAIPNLKKSPDLDGELLRQLVQLVKYLTIRQEELFAKVDRHKPEYVPTYRQLVTSMVSKTQYDGDFPWLVTKKLATLEQENKLLRDQMELTKARHYDLVNRTDAAVAPIAKENAELREKLTKYRDDLVSVYRRLGDAEEQVRRSQAGIIDSTVLQFTGMQAGLGV